MTATLLEPGIYDLPEDAYHADPVPGGSLTSSGVRKLLPPSCPARYFYERANPQPPSAAMELGTAAHRLVLGAGKPVACVEADNWRTKAANETADAIRADGGVPLLRRDYDTVHAMAGAIRAHPIAAALFDPERGGLPEQTLMAPDPGYGIWRRILVDWLPDHEHNDRVILADYKTARSANPASFAKSVADYGYHIQQAFYEAVFTDVTGLPAEFVFAVQEKDPPFLVTVCQLDAEAVRAGQQLVRTAMEIYRDCTEAGAWPGYADDVVLISLPYWAIRKAEESYP